MPIDVLGFDHVELSVTDIQRSRDFYHRVLAELGFRPAVDTDDHVIWLT
jgi:catechol 2,3-dioxygenase-like lactoylglutathione lyase family enzyme